jgi:tripartite-type tricarboxylate transporter receptor subunit TctC
MNLNLSINRRLALATGAAAFLSPELMAQSKWPNKPIRLIIPFAPGGSNDIIGRLLSTKMSQRLGQPVVVENKGGSGGTIGTDYVAKSQPDGYTLLFASTSITTNAAGNKKLPYDLIQDLQPIGGVGSTPFVIVVANNVKARTLKEFIEMAKANPRGVSYGTAGIGGINHLGTELFAIASNIELTHIPYKGIGPSFADVMSGNLQMILPTVASVVQQVKAGNMRALAVTSLERSPLLPDVPTTDEAGMPGFQLEAWFGLLAAAHTPPEIINRINEELFSILSLPDVKEILARDGAVPRPSSPEAFKKLIASDLERWNRVIKESSLKLD